MMVSCTVDLYFGGRGNEKASHMQCIWQTVRQCALFLFNLEWRKKKKNTENLPLIKHSYRTSLPFLLLYLPEGTLWNL